MKIKEFHNKRTGDTLPAGIWGENFDKYCLTNPDEFEVIYSDELGEQEEKPTVYSKEELKGYSMKSLREVYDSLAESVENAPAPTTSKDGIIKAILEMQEA